jgi:hypothetical protein
MRSTSSKANWKKKNSMTSVCVRHLRGFRILKPLHADNVHLSTFCHGYRMWCITGNVKNLTKYKNIQQPKVWPTSPSAHRSVLVDSPLFSGAFRPQFTYLNILHPKTAQGVGQAGKRRICIF